MSTWQKAEPSHSGAQRRIASAIIKQLITRQITAIARTPRRDATVGSAARRRGPLQTKALYLRSSACKSRLKQLETGRLFFLGHSAKQMNHLFSAAAWLAVAVNSGEPFVCLWPWCAERLFNDCCTWEGFMPRWDVFLLLPLFFLLPASKVNPPSCDLVVQSLKSPLEEMSGAEWNICERLSYFLHWPVNQNPHARHADQMQNISLSCIYQIWKPLLLSIKHPSNFMHKKHPNSLMRTKQNKQSRLDCLPKKKQLHHLSTGYKC